MMGDNKLMWDRRADLMQQSLDRYFGAPGPQLFHNWHPCGPGDDDTFNFWWLAHVIDVRIDAYHRTRDGGWLEQARAVVENLRERNSGSLLNDYFDDMLWLALALLRLADATGDATPLAESVQIWEHVNAKGWNEHAGGGIAWRASQLDYKNTPANGPFIILSARLHQRTGEARYLAAAERTMAWLEANLVRVDGFVEDGINRLGDQRIDTQWRYTYNQGLYIGACVELAKIGDRPEFLARASRTAATAIIELTDDGVFTETDSDGGDEGLFKGIFYRYATDLVHTTNDAALRYFLLSSTNRLWENGFDGGSVRAGGDWRHPARGRTAYSTQLSAIMATEMCATLAAANVAGG